MVLEEQTIEEMEFRIKLLNYTLNWLRSDDPFLRDPKWSGLVPAAIEKYEGQLHQVTEVCRRRKVERDGDPNTNPVNINLKPAEMTGESRMG